MTDYVIEKLKAEIENLKTENTIMRKALFEISGYTEEIDNIFNNAFEEIKLLKKDEEE